MNSAQEIQYLIGAIDLVRAEPDSADKLERLRTLELCLIAVARTL
jgi:hypothetical protein